MPVFPLTTVTFEHHFRLWWKSMTFIIHYSLTLMPRIKISSYWFIIIEMLPHAIASLGRWPLACYWLTYAAQSLRQYFGTGLYYRLESSIATWYRAMIPLIGHSDTARPASRMMTPERMAIGEYIAFQRRWREKISKWPNYRGRVIVRI